jgi:hypothetical protein
VRAANLYEFKAKLLDLRQDSVQGGLVREHPRQDGVRTARLDPEVRKRATDRFAQVAANADLVTLLVMPSRTTARLCHVFLHASHHARRWCCWGCCG